MDTQNAAATEHWTEDDSIAFIEYGRYFIPQRELQLETICELIAPAMGRVVELCCGEGALSERILDRYAGSSVLAFDGSEIMLERARRRLSRFGPRARVNAFELSELAWQNDIADVVGIVSILSIHHLDDTGKRSLFKHAYRMLRPGGIMVLADTVKPTSERAMLHTSREYERDVRRRARELDGDKVPRRILEDDTWNQFRYAEDPTEHPSTIFDQLRWMQEAGFTDVDVYWMHAGHAIFGGEVPAAR